MFIQFNEYLNSIIVLLWIPPAPVFSSKCLQQNIFDDSISSVLQITVLQSTVLQSTVLQSTVLQITVLQSTVLQSTV